MSRRVKIVELNDDEKRALQQGYKYSSKASFSRRCHIILLKNQGRSSKEIAEIFGTTDQPVNNWVKRFLAEGISGLKTKPGQGRRAIFDKEKDAEKVKAIVKKERQRLKLAKQELETELDKKFSIPTLTRFLKLLAAPIDVSD